MEIDDVWYHNNYLGYKQHHCYYISSFLTFNIIFY